MQVAFNHVGPVKWVVCGSEDSMIYMWDLNSKQVVDKLEGHKGELLEFSSFVIHRVTTELIPSCLQ